MIYPTYTSRKVIYLIDISRKVMYPQIAQSRSFCSFFKWLEILEDTIKYTVYLGDFLKYIEKIIYNSNLLIQIKCHNHRLI